MANVADERNPMPKLKPPTPPPVENEPMEMEPLNDSHLFDKKKKVTISEPEHIVEPIEAPIEKPVKKKRKKRVLSAEHKAKLEAGRLKGLETRRRKKAERQAKIKELKQAKEQMYYKKRGLGPEKTGVQVNNTAVTKDIYVEPKKMASTAKKIIENPEVRHQAETKTIRETKDPDAEFKKFYGMMSRYEKIRFNQRQEYLKKQKAQQPPPPVHTPSQARFRSKHNPQVRNLRARFGRSNGNRRSFVDKPPENNYMNFFT